MPILQGSDNQNTSSSLEYNDYCLIL